MNVELRQAIENLYSAFANYAKPDKIEVCPCGCTALDAAAPLLAVPLRSIPYDDLTDFAFSALTTQGGLEDFRYLLPRLFEGLVEFDFGIDPEVVLGKLLYADWRSWPAAQAVAVEDFVAVMWKVAIANYPVSDQLANFGDIETVLSSIARTGLGLNPYLELWTQRRDQPSDLNLMQFVACCGADFAGGNILSYGFWEKSQAQAEELRRWVLLPATMERIRSLARLLPPEDCEHLLTEALRILESEFARLHA